MRKCIFVLLMLTACTGNPDANFAEAIARYRAECIDYYKQGVLKSAAQINACESDKAFTRARAVGEPDLQTLVDYYAKRQTLAQGIDAGKIKKQEATAREADIESQYASTFGAASASGAMFKNPLADPNLVQGSMLYYAVFK